MPAQGAMLLLDDEERPGAADLLAHPWVDSRVHPPPVRYQPTAPDSGEVPSPFPMRTTKGQAASDPPDELPGAPPAGSEPKEAQAPPASPAPPKLKTPSTLRKSAAAAAAPPPSVAAAQPPPAEPGPEKAMAAPSPTEHKELASPAASAASAAAATSAPAAAAATSAAAAAAATSAAAAASVTAAAAAASVTAAAAAASVTVTMPALDASATPPLPSDARSAIASSSESATGPATTSTQDRPQHRAPLTINIGTSHTSPLVPPPSPLPEGSVTSPLPSQPRASPAHGSSAEVASPLSGNEEAELARLHLADGPPPRLPHLASASHASASLPPGDAAQPFGHTDLETFTDAPSHLETFTDAPSHLETFTDDPSATQMGQTCTGGGTAVQRGGGGRGGRAGGAPEPSIYGPQTSPKPEPSIYGRQTSTKPEPSIYGPQTSTDFREEISSERRREEQSSAGIGTAPTHPSDDTFGVARLWTKRVSRSRLERQPSKSLSSSTVPSRTSSRGIMRVKSEERGLLSEDSDDQPAYPPKASSKPGSSSMRRSFSSAAMVDANKSGMGARRPSFINSVLPTPLLNQDESAQQ